MATAGPWSTLKAKNGKPLLSETTNEVLQSLKFENMTPVQAATIPLFLQNKDVAVEVYFSNFSINNFRHAQVLARLLLLQFQSLKCSQEKILL